MVWFSCGAASACAAKLSVDKYPDAQVLYCDTSPNEHPDNLRFLRDVEKWIGRKIERLKSVEYDSMRIYDVFRKEQYIVGIHGAPCTRALKKEVRQDMQDIGDTHIFGYTSEETKRITRLVENNPELLCEFPLRDAGVNKADCYHMIKRAGIDLPAMYKLGYNNNNCIGCVKGGMWYWNKIRVDFPTYFARMAALEREIGASILRKRKKPLYLDELDPKAGRKQKEPNIECGVGCSTQETPHDR